MRFLWPNLLDATADFPADLLIAVFATGAKAAGRWKHEHPDATTVVFNTDLVSYSWWVPEGIDLFLVTSIAAEAWVRRSAPRAEVAVVTAPVRPQFYEPLDRTTARAALGVPNGDPCVLLMAGGWGLGSLPVLARHLADAGIWALAVAGNNTRLASQLTRLATADKRIVPFGYTDRVAELMAAADVLVCAPGDTCREARAVGRGMVLLDVVPGHGRENLQHELELGHAAVAPTDPADISRTVAAFLDDPDHEPSHRVGSPEQWDREFTDALARVGVSLG
jgi:UDP-N-acetylglucosamine:LPS N-acetylglucosamine transferase